MTARKQTRYNLETYMCIHVLQKFERLNLGKFHLNREGQYYYLCLDKAYVESFAPPAPHVLTDRLTALSQQHSPGQPPTPHSERSSLTNQPASLPTSPSQCPPPLTFD